MRPIGTPQQLAARRARAHALLAAGQSVAAVAQAVGASRQAIYQWQASAKSRRRKRAPRTLGRPCKLTAGQQRQLLRVLTKGAQAYGYPTDHWTLERVGLVIFQRFAVRYQASGVWGVLQRLGWSNQKMARVGLERDEAAIAHWKRHVWPQVKKSP